MLFVAPEFLLVFLPITLLLYWGMELRVGGRWAVGLLLLASMVFYGWSGWGTLALFCGSLTANFFIGRWIARSSGRGALTLGVLLNLALLGIFKYADFGIDILTSLTGWQLAHLELRLPLAISFYTFQQIVYLVQCHRSRKSEFAWQDYALAVAFFPHLIAGPLVHYHDLVPQFHSQKRRKVAAAHFQEALSLFVVALAKKLLVADTLSKIASPLFRMAESGKVLSVAEAWQAALAYALQIYFDFSAYSEMAMGLALMFGIRLPVNFKRPYRAVDLRDFWRRWHITLSEFLRDYLYIPLGGNRRGPVRRWINLFLTMLLGGLWHGASWNFVAWGGLHGLFLAINHAWAGLSPWRFPRRMARVMTFVVVVFLWVPFRAETWAATEGIWKSMVGVVSWEQVEPRRTDWTAMQRTLSPVASYRSENWDGPIWHFFKEVEHRRWLVIGGAGLLVFLCRSNLDLAASAKASGLRRAFLLGALVFAILARSFYAPPGEFIYFRF